MSMAITNNYSSYGTNYATSNSAKQAAEGKKADTGNNTMDEKTTARDKVSNYYNSLQKKYECVRNGKVSIAGSYLNECANNPEKAKSLENELSLYKELSENGRKNAEANANSLGARLVNYEETWSYDSKGNLTMIAQSTVVSGDAAKEAAEKKAAEEEKAKKKQQKKLTEEKTKERIEEKKSEKADKDKRAEQTTTNTDKVDSEIEKLKAEQEKMKQALNTADESEQEDVRRRLSELEQELSQKDTDTYRRQHARVTIDTKI